MADAKALVPLSGAAPGVEVSPVNAIAIRETSLGQYLESINTGNTWFSKVQESLGFDAQPFTALDALYITTGVAGMALLVVPLAAGSALSLPVLAVGTVLTSVSAVGMAEHDRATKIGSGIAAGSLIVFQPQAASFAFKQAVGATTETIKQTATLATTGIGVVTSGLGFATATLGTAAVLHQRSKKRKR